MTAITLIHNPTAGIQPIAAPTAIALVGRGGHRAHYVSSKRAASVAASLRRGTRLIAVAGGDGTVAKVLRAGKDAPLTVAVIPSGVANNIARSLGVSSALAEAVAAWQRSRPRPVHLVEVEVGRKTRLAVESIGIGALAAATSTMPHRTTSAFARAGMLAETRRHFRDVIAGEPAMERLAIDGVPVKGRPLFAEILNIPFTGPNLPLATGRALDAGHLTIVYGTEAHRRPLLDWLDAGAHASQRPALPTARAKTFTIEWAGGPLRIDDELTGSRKGRLTVKIQRARIRLLAPP